MKKRLLFFLVLIISIFSLLGCSKNKKDDNENVVSADNNEKPIEQQDNSASTNKEKYIDFAVYLKHKEMPYIFGERFEIKSDDPILQEKTIEEIALDKLFNYDKDSFISPVPKGTKVLELEKKGSTIYLNLSKEFIDNMTKDKTLTQMAIDSIVNTLTFFPENEKVVFKVEGETIKDVNGISLDKDFTFSSDFIPDK